MTDQNSGGFHIGKVGGAVGITAGGDIVGRDKITTTTTTTTIKGFADDDKKRQFQSEIEQLREALRAMKAAIEASGLDDDSKDEMVSQILQATRGLKEAKEKAAEVSPKKDAPAEVSAAVESALDRAGGLVDSLQRVAGKAADIGEKVGEFVARYGPLVLSARHLFGLP